MIENTGTLQRKAALAEDAFRAAAAVASKGDYGTLVLDGVGTIRNCGTAAGEMFGGSLADFSGMPISALIADFALGGISPSYNARYLAHLCAAEGWRKFEAVDLQGSRFPIEISMSRVRTDGQDLILLNLRRAENQD